MGSSQVLQEHREIDTDSIEENATSSAEQRKQHSGRSQMTNVNLSGKEKWKAAAQHMGGMTADDVFWNNEIGETGTQGVWEEDGGEGGQGHVDASVCSTALFWVIGQHGHLY